MVYSMNGMLLVLCMVLVAIAGGCSPDTSRNQTTATVNATVNWDDLGTLVVETWGIEVIDYDLAWKRTASYLVEEDAASQLIKALRGNTVAPLDRREIQNFGGPELLVHAFDQRGEPMYQFAVDIQYVEGMGDKLNRHPNADLLFAGQEKRRTVVLGIIEKLGGASLTTAQFEEHAKKFEGIDYMHLYWKN